MLLHALVRSSSVFLTFNCNCLKYNSVLSASALPYCFPIQLKKPAQFRYFGHISEDIMSKTALLILCEGSEEMEAVISADILRRAGIKVTIAGLQGAIPTKCSRDIVIMPDASIQDVAKENYDAVILPGGLQGAESLAKSDIVKQILQTQEKSGRLIAAICAAPIALKSHSIGTGKAITSHPCKQADLSSGDYQYLEDRVVVAEQLITSRGPGTAFEFALAIVKHLLGEEKSNSLKGPMLIKN